MQDVDVLTLGGRVGDEISVTDWMTVDQTRINQFADATGDHQWIHVDAERAAASPFKSTIAHGFLTLSLISTLARSALAFPGVKMAVNYGVNRVRFPSPVPAGARIRGRFALANLEPVIGGVQITWNAVVEREGSDKPCCVAEWVVRYYV